MKLLADENVHGDIVTALRSDGHDVRWVVEGGWAGSEDLVLLELARREGRLILTADKDFGELVEFDPNTPPVGVILLRYRFLDINRMIHDLQQALRYVISHGLEDRGFILVLEEARMRVRTK